ncbi:MAG: hypothetical protein ABH837_03150 [bacterium]
MSVVSDLTGSKTKTRRMRTPSVKIKIRWRFPGWLGAILGTVVILGIWWLLWFDTASIFHQIFIGFEMNNLNIRDYTRIPEFYDSSFRVLYSGGGTCLFMLVTFKWLFWWLK